MPSLRPRRAPIALAAAALWLAVGAADAQPPPEGRADALYREGTALLEQGRVGEACAKLAESHAIDPATGTLLALARCHERAGKVASAWSAYQDAEARARRAGQADREAAAREQARLLLPRLPRLTVVVDASVAALPGFEVVRDEVTLGAAVLGTAVPVDPGEHQVEVRAPGRVAARRSVRLAEGESQTLTFDALEPAPVDAPPGPAPAPSRPPVEAAEGGLSGLQVAGLVLGGAGLATLGVGAAFGLVASSENDDSIERCAPFEDGDGGTEAEYAACTSSRADAGSAADVSTALFVAGGVVAAVGLTLLVVGGDDAPADAARLELRVAPTGLIARGVFR
jgi:hypothetical protein